MSIPETMKRLIDQQLKNKVMLYMKGTPEDARCGFSTNVVKILKKHGIEFVYCNVLEDLAIRQWLPLYKDWPTFPQLYINGKLRGGHDIVLDLDRKQILWKCYQDWLLEPEESA
jgi:monothiol glutaredoxin